MSLQPTSRHRVLQCPGPGLVPSREDPAPKGAIARGPGSYREHSPGERASTGALWEPAPRAMNHFEDGGSGRNRTGVDGFAIRCMTTLPPSLWKSLTERETAGVAHHFEALNHYRTACVWSGKPGSNRRPQPWQGCALPTELFPHCYFVTATAPVAGTGEAGRPPPSTLARVRSTN